MDRRDFAHDDFSEWAQSYLEDHPDEYIPTVKEICPACGGEGRYVNPAIDSNGITQDEM